jgi:hypothetical protein
MKRDPRIDAELRRERWERAAHLFAGLLGFLTIIVPVGMIWWWAVTAERRCKAPSVWTCEQGVAYDRNSGMVGRGVCHCEKHP